MLNNYTKIKKYGIHSYFDYHILGVVRFVRELGYGEDYITVALLHDILEDTGMIEDILNTLFSYEVVEAVGYLTKIKGSNYDEKTYLKHIKNSHLSTIVKVADATFNMYENIRNKNKERTKKIYFLFSNVDYLMNINLCLQNILMLDKQNKTREAASLVNTLIFNIKKGKDPSCYLNIVFCKLIPEELTSFTLVSLLRSSCTYKQDIKSWINFYNIAKQKLEEEGKDVRKELYGLDRNLKSLFSSEEISYIGLATLASYSNTSFKTTDKTDFINL